MSPSDRVHSTVDEQSSLLHQHQREGPEVLPSSSSPTTTTITPAAAATTMSILATLAAVSGATGVALGAFGAHGLKKRISDPARLQSWGTAAQYQLIHSVATLVAANTMGHTRAGRWGAGLFLAGISMFSGSIYLLTLDPARFGKTMGPVTPLGGLCFIAGWTVLAVGTRGRLR
ncbi:hypothetical protein PG994_007938 [Apiospora phragmitis]|uniref:DUF423 domain-containing protein n=1 Tax=Apiospora phragmitis TaxID=2905665 RepID=A0ABR1URP4_9PEZI